MIPQKAFYTYWGVKLHFTQKQYSMLKYGINTKAAIDKYESFSQEQQYRFDWVSKRFPDPQDLMYCCIGCEFDDVSVHFGTKDDILDSFHKFKRRREAMTYTLKQDIIKYRESEIKSFDKLLMKYFVSEYTPEFILLSTHETDKLETIYNSPNYIWAKPKILRLIKYQDFFNCKKYLSLLKP